MITDLTDGWNGSTLSPLSHFDSRQSYDPYYQPFTSDQANSYCFSNQLKALQMNLTTLSESIEALISSLDESEARKGFRDPPGIV